MHVVYIRHYNLSEKTRTFKPDTKGSELVPGMKERYIKRYGKAYELPSTKANELTGIFQRICKDNGILSTPDECFGFMQELPDKYPQMSIFDL